MYANNKNNESKRKKYIQIIFRDIIQLPLNQIKTIKTILVLPRIVRGERELEDHPASW